MFSRNLVLILIFFLLSLIGAFQHELSLDEARVWISMQEINTGSIIQETRCEMHCLPWFYAVKSLTSVFANPFSMQVLSVLLGTLVFGLIAIFSPFTFLEKSILLFNYYFLFEYNLLSRPYVLMTLGIVLICLTFTERLRRPLPFIIAILFLENSTYFGIFLSIPFVSLFMWEFLNGKISLEKKARWKLITATAAYVCIFIWYALPVSGLYQCFNLSTKDLNVNFLRFQESSWDVARAFFPLATDTWNEHLFDTYPYARSILSLFWFGFIFLSLWFFRKRRELVYLLGTGVFLIFAYRFYKPIYFGSFLRHLGALPIMYIGCMWLWRKTNPEDKKLKAMFILFLLPGAWSGLRMYKEDFYRNFSNGKEVNKFISSKELSNHEIIPDSLLFTSSYLVYSDRKYYSFMNKDHVRYFPLPGNRVQVPVAPAKVRGIHLVPRLPEGILREIIRERIQGEKSEGLLILNYPAGNMPREMNLKLLKEFTGAINANEDYSIFIKIPD